MSKYQKYSVPQPTIKCMASELFLYILAHYTFYSGASIDSLWQPYETIIKDPSWNLYLFCQDFARFIQDQYQ